MGEDECSGVLRSALRQLVRVPERDSDGSILTQIGELVFHGEGTADRRLNDVLKEVLLERGDGRPVLTEKSYDSSGPLDPLFVASQSLAQDCWVRAAGLRG